MYIRVRSTQEYVVYHYFLEISLLTADGIMDNPIKVIPMAHQPYHGLQPRLECGISWQNEISLTHRHTWYFPIPMGSSINFSSFLIHTTQSKLIFSDVFFITCKKEATRLILKYRFKTIFKYSKYSKHLSVLTIINFLLYILLDI